MDKIRFAVIGQGHIGKRHAEMIRRNGSCVLQCVCDILPPEELGLDEMKEKFYRSYDELLDSEPAVVVVNICVPKGLHCEFAIKALKMGKHVFIE